ncbi:bacterio-opsin activator domain-containing protein [Halonotius roseus]|uniref:PAS domain-containing protein n=1 Tax=Halonotius roseus TaxID=2511997 RepID=A0A544QS13_9EURY|nr:bacterio-opsin activator domain-containing protein [Halonotius roseus]TQQ82212.1 PAS domain-containing protein [Halonotius roseus]
MSALRVLAVYSSDDRDRLTDALAAAGCEVQTVETATTALGMIGTASFDCLISEYALPGDDGLALRSAVRQLAPELPFILLTDVDEGELSPSFDTDVDRYVHKNGADTPEQLIAALPSSAGGDGQSPQDISGHEPAPTELQRAIEAAPIGVSLTDPDLADNPLVYVNDTWGEFTGYDTEEMLGRNPRLLQGLGTDSETKERLAAAIANEEPTTVELRNYRKDGTPFWNELTIAPIFDENDEVTHYVGFQIDVTDRREAMELAEERAEKLSQHRQTLRRLLDRIDGLLSDVSGVLIDASDREVIEHQVCEAIAAEPGYTAGWIGRVDGETFTIAASSGCSPPSSIPRAELAAPIREAIAADEPRRCSACADGELTPEMADAEQLLVVPLSYGDRRYGYLGVYATDGDTLDDREQTVIASLGTMIANGIHAAETAQVLTTDQVTELQIDIRDPSVSLSQIADTLGTPVERVGTTRAGEGRHEWYLAAESCTVPTAELESLSFVTDARTVSATDTDRTIAVTVETTTPAGLLADQGAVVTGITATADGAVLTVETPPDRDVRSLLELLGEQYDGVDLRARTQCERHTRQLNEFTAEIDERLTDRQQEALEAAALNGYFEWPRPVDGTEIAETMDITRQTFHQHLRAAQRKLVDAYVDADER